MANVAHSEVIPPANGHAPVVALTKQQTPFDLLAGAIERGVDIATLERLMALYERHEAGEQRKASAAAMNRFKAEAPQIVKDATGEFPSKDGKYVIEWDYATLENVCSKLIKTLSAHGISHSWKPSQTTRDWIKITCVLTHELGHVDETTLEGPPDTTGSKNAVQSICSTVTYLERMTLLAACGLAPVGVDKDGMTPSAGPKVESDLVDKNCAAMAAAKTREDLRKLFQAAYSDASTANDSKAQGRYILVYETRKRELK